MDRGISYSLNVGKFNLEQIRQRSDYDPSYASDPKLRSNILLPKISHTAQMIEVRRPHVGDIDESNLKSLCGSYVLIENCRPELFLRRDFIKRFVDRGIVHISHIHHEETGYRMTTRDNFLILTMGQREYFRFGLVATKVVTHSKNNKEYRISIDLKNEGLKTNNKFQDKMMMILRRLSPINKVYFRFSPNEPAKLPIVEAERFFRFVIDEYAQDGCQPVPLTGCRLVSQSIQRKWLNSSQSYPTVKLLPEDMFGETGDLARNNVDKLTSIIDCIDWLGYQLLSLDCTRNEIGPNLNLDFKETNSVNVACYQYSGIMDYQHVLENLPTLFETCKLDDILLRALILYSNDDNRRIPNFDAHDNSGVVYLQDCSNGSKAASEITVIGMPALASR